MDKPITLAEFNALALRAAEIGARLYNEDYRRLEWTNYGGEKHRDDDLPAVILEIGTCYWMQHGELHRDGDRPATIYPDGSMYWFKNNARHRGDDQPAVMLAKDGVVHTRIWYQHGTMRRVNGRLPVIVGPGRLLEWWVNGERIGDQDDIPEGADIPLEYDVIATKSALKM